MNTWQTPSRCLITGTLASRAMRSIRPFPPRGTMTSTCFSSAIRQPTAARSVVATTCTAFSVRPAARRPSWTHAAIARLLRMRLGAAAQDRRVAGLEAQSRGVGGHVRPRLVDDADDAQRHAHQADLDAGRTELEVRDLADGIGQRRDFREAVRHRGDGLRRQRQPVDEGGVVPGRRCRGDVLGVGGDELRLVAPEGGGRCGERGVLRPRIGARDVPRGRARGRSDTLHVGADVGKRAKSGDGEVGHRCILARSRRSIRPSRLR